MSKVCQVCGEDKELSEYHANKQQLKKENDMNSSMMIHDVNSVTTSGVSYSNANAITLTIEGEGGKIELTLFCLPTDIANRIDQALNPCGCTVSEEAIRKDERRKIASQLAPIQFPDGNATYTFF